MNTVAADRTFTAKSLLVVDTYVVGRLADNTFHYEIHLAPDAGPDAHRTVLVTRDVAAYEFALALEGKDARVNASWHTRRQGSRSHSVLDTLEAPVS